MPATGSVMTARPTLVSVYDGQRCAGFILSRGCAGFEAFDAEQHSLGTFATEREAARAIPAQAGDAA